jgi:oxygen-independent coproporphyrinogen-3 oxidase
MRHKKPENWLRAIDRNGHGLAEERDLPAPERAGEALMMGLRLAQGVDLAAIAARTGIAAEALVDGAAIARLAGHGLLRQADSRLTVTPQGMLLLDGILAQIVAV